MGCSTFYKKVKAHKARQKLEAIKKVKARKKIKARKARKARKKMMARQKQRHEGTQVCKAREARRHDKTNLDNKGLMWHITLI